MDVPSGCFSHGTRDGCRLSPDTPDLLQPPLCLTQPAAQVELETVFNRCPHREPKDGDGWAGSCNACWSLLPRIITSCTSRNLRS